MNLIEPETNNLADKIKSRVKNFEAFEKQLVSLNEIIERISEAYSSLADTYSKLPVSVTSFLSHVPQLKTHLVEMTSTLERDIESISAHVD